MATRAEQIRKRLQQGEEAKERVLSGMYNQPKTPVATVNPRTQAIRSYVPPDPAGTPMKDLMNQFPSINPMESSLMRGVSGDKAAQRTWEQNSGMKFKPIQGPPAPPQLSEYEKGLQEIEAKRPDGFLGNLYDYTVRPVAWAGNAAFYGNPVGNFVTRAVGTGAETVLGSPSARPGTTGNATADKIADITGTIGGVAGLAFNPAAAGVRGQNLVTGPLEAARAALSTGAGQNAQRLLSTGINKVAPRMSTQTADRLARTGLEGAMTGGIGGVAAGLVQGQDSNQDIARNALLGAGLGAAGDMAFGTLSNLFKKNGISEKEVAEILALPEPRSQSRIREASARSQNAYGADPIINPYTFELPDASPGLRAQAANAQAGRAEVRQINQTLNELESQYEQRVIEEYKFLKESRDTRRGVAQGNLQRNTTGDVVGRSGRMSNNPLWYQQFYKANGKAPSNKDLYQLARDRVDNGFQDESGFVPSWRQEVGYDEQLQAYQGVRDNLQGSIREMDPALNVTDKPIVTQSLKDLRREGSPPRPRKTVQETATSADIGYVDSLDIPEFLLRRNGAKRSSTPADPLPVTSAPTSDPIMRPGQLEEKSGLGILSNDTGSQLVTESRIRDRLYQVLDNAEKEARERIRKRRGRLNSNPLPEWTDYTIIGAAKLGKGTIKFADWTEEMVKEFGESFRPQAERVFQAAKEELRRAERLASKEGQEAAAFNSQDIGDVDTFAQKISQNPTKKKQSFAQRTEKIRTQMIDDLAPLEGLEKRVRGSVSSAEDSLYKSARLFRGMPAKANQVVKERLGPVVDAVEKSGFSTYELGYYTLARHAKDVNAAGYKSGFTNREIESVLQRYNTPEMEKARQELVKVNNDMLNELADAGVISRELYNTLTDRWKNYVPLFRAMEDEGVEFGGGLSKALANVASPIKALKGSERKVIDPLENMVKNIFQSTSAAERNRVAQQLARLAKDDVEEIYIRKLGPDEEVGRKNVVNVKVNGENVKYEVEPEVYKALLNLDQESGNMLIRMFQKPASLLRAGATLTPEFSLRNPMRDIMQAYVVSKSGFNPITDFGAGLIQSITKGDLYKQWVKDMGDFGNVISMDRNVHKEALKRVLKEKPSKKFVNILTGKSLLDLLRVITDTTESATKVGEYRAALRKGESRQEAAYRSRDIMDFGRSGVSIRQMNKVIAFLNANLQGKSKLLRALKEDWLGVTTRAAVGVTLPTVGVFFLQKYYSNDVQKKTIEESPDWLRNSFWLVPVPGTDQVARIPKPFDLAAIFANAPERALQYAYDKDKEAFDGFAKQSLSEAAIPVQITGLLPFFEGMANYSSFRQGSIIPMAEAGREFRDQYDPVNTTETAKLLARGAEALTGGEGAFKNFSSPRIMDNTIKGLTAGLGTYATSAIDSLLEGKVLGKQVYKPVIDKPEKPEKRIEQRPLAKAFLVDPLQGGKSTEIFYEAREKLTKQKNSANFNETKFDSEKKRTLKRLDKISSSMSNITKEIRAVERDTSLTPAQKRNQIEPLIQERNELARNAVQDYDLKKYKK